MIKIIVPLTIDEKYFERAFIRAAEVRGITVKKVTDRGPSGGWPEYEISSPKENEEEFYSFMEAVGFDKEDVDAFKS